MRHVCCYRSLCARLNPQHTGNPDTCDCKDVQFLRKAIAAQHSAQRRVNNPPTFDDAVRAHQERGELARPVPAAPVDTDAQELPKPWHSSCGYDVPWWYQICDICGEQRTAASVDSGGAVSGALDDAGGR